MKKIIVLFLALLVCACAKKSTLPEISTESPTTLWATMLKHSAHTPTGPFSDQISLRFGSEGDTRRVTALVWGNDDRTIRLDVSAGVGALVARIRQDENRFLLILARENKAYFNEGSPLLVIGTPLPFNLPQLAALLNGRFEAVFGNQYLASHVSGNGNVSFTLPSGAELELDSAGLPVGWSQKNGWNLAIGYESGALPKSLRFKSSTGRMAVVLVKEREFPKIPFTEEQMHLETPAGMKQLPLSSYQPN